MNDNELAQLIAAARSYGTPEMMGAVQRLEEARAERMRLEAEHERLLAEQRDLLAKLRRPFSADHPFLYTFLLLVLPLWIGYFSAAKNRSLAEAPTGIILGLGFGLGMGLLLTLLNRRFWPKDS